MIKPISDMPDGTIGFRAHGAVTRDDYRDVLEPAMRAAAETGEIRMLYELAPGFEMKAGAMLEDAKTGLGLGIGHHSAWKRTAVVTDADWVANAMTCSRGWRRVTCACSGSASWRPPSGGWPGSSLLRRPQP